MTTRNSIAYSIAGKLNQPVNLLLIENIKFSIDYWRAFLVRQDYEKNGRDARAIQTITKTLIKVDKADVCNIDTDCAVLRTTNKMPTTASIKEGSPFLTVQFADLSEVIGYVPYTDLAFSSNGKYLKNRRFYTFNNNYIYVFNQPKIGFVTVSAVWNNPTELMHDCIDDSNCVTDDDPYPLSGHMIQIITRGILSGEFPIIPNNHETNVASSLEGRFRQPAN